MRSLCLRIVTSHTNSPHHDQSILSSVNLFVFLLSFCSLSPESGGLSCFPAQLATSTDSRLLVLGTVLGYLARDIGRRRDSHSRDHVCQRALGYSITSEVWYAGNLSSLQKYYGQFLLCMTPRHGLSFNNEEKANYEKGVWRVFDQVNKIPRGFFFRDHLAFAPGCMHPRG